MTTKTTSQSNSAVAELDNSAAPGTLPREITKTLLVGLDLGTNTTCIEYSNSTSTETELSELIPSLVGYARSGILPDVIPDNETTLFGTDALKYQLHLDLVQPLRDGIIEDMDAVRDYLVHLKAKTNSDENTEIRAVIGIPANTGPEARENVRVAVTGLFDKVILIPEPFLAALGCREVSKSSETGYIDPISNSIRRYRGRIFRYLPNPRVLPFQRRPNQLCIRWRRYRRRLQCSSRTNLPSSPIAHSKSRSRQHSKSPPKYHHDRWRQHDFRNRPSSSGTSLRRRFRRMRGSFRRQNLQNSGSHRSFDSCSSSWPPPMANTFEIG